MADNDNERTVTTWKESTDWGWVAVLIILILSITVYNLYELHLASEDNKAKIEMLQKQLEAKE